MPATVGAVADLLACPEPVGPGTPQRPEVARARRTWRLDASVLALVAAVIRIPALLASRHLTFDDGVYGSAVLAMRDGAQPFRQVFSSQGPLQLPLLWLADLVGFRTEDAPRLAMVASGVVVAVAVYAIGRRVGSRGGALLAAALATTSGSILWVTASLSGDGPAIAFAVTAVALAFAFRAKPTTVRAVLVGLAMGATLSVKLLAAPVAIPVGLLLLAGGRLKSLSVAVGAAIFVFLAAALPWGIDRVWEQSIDYHQGARRTDSYGGNAWRLVRTLCERDVVLVVVALLSLATVLVVRARVRRAGTMIGGAGRAGAASEASGDAAPARRDMAVLLDRFTQPRVLFGLWLVVQAALIVWEPEMWRPHVSEVVVPIALLVALRPPPWRLVAVGVVAALPWYVVNVHTMLWPSGYPRDAAAVVERLRDLPPGAWAISDDPGLVWRADRRSPADLVDASIKRVEEKLITPAKLAARQPIVASARSSCGRSATAASRRCRASSRPTATRSWRGTAARRPSTRRPTAAPDPRAALLSSDRGARVAGRSGRWPGATRHGR